MAMRMLFTVGISTVGGDCKDIEYVMYTMQEENKFGGLIKCKCENSILGFSVRTI